MNVAFDQVVNEQALQWSTNGTILWGIEFKPEISLQYWSLTFRCLCYRASCAVEMNDAGYSRKVDSKRTLLLWNQTISYSSCIGKKNEKKRSRFVWLSQGKPEDKQALIHPFYNIAQGNKIPKKLMVQLFYKKH